MNWDGSGWVFLIFTHKHSHPNSPYQSVSLNRTVEKILFVERSTCLQQVLLELHCLFEGNVLSIWSVEREKFLLFIKLIQVSFKIAMNYTVSPSTRFCHSQHFWDNRSSIILCKLQTQWAINRMQSFLSSFCRRKEVSKNLFLVAIRVGDLGWMSLGMHVINSSDTPTPLRIYQYGFTTSFNKIHWILL